MKKYRYGFIGCGNMGGVLVGVAAKAVGGEKVAVCDHNEGKTSALKEKFGVSVVAPKTITRECQFVVMGVKPQTMQAAISEIKNELCERSDVVLVSMAAGLSMQKLKAYVGENFEGSILRIMPNLPCALGAGVVLYSTMGTPNELKREFVRDFSAAGLIDEIDEAYMDGGSALTGCGPAFVYYFAEGLIGGAMKCGIDKEKATAYAAQTILGGAKMLLTGEEPAALRKKVCSPNGTTLEGIKALDDGEFLKVVSSAIEAAERRAKELQKNG